MQVRFDDTNPTKEKDEYVENIIKDMQTLGLQYKTITYTSDYFPQVRQLAVSRVVLLLLLLTLMQAVQCRSSAMAAASRAHCITPSPTGRDALCTLEGCHGTPLVILTSPFLMNLVCVAAGVPLQMLDLGERLIRAGVLYADDTPVDQMREVGGLFC